MSNIQLQKVGVIHELPLLSLSIDSLSIAIDKAVRMIKLVLLQISIFMNN